MGGDSYGILRKGLIIGGIMVRDVLEDYEAVSTEDLVNPWRMAKGDLIVAVNSRGKISRAIPQKMPIIKDLVERGVVPYHYEVYGIRFLELQLAFRSPWAIRRMEGLMEQLGVGLTNSQLDAMYQNTCRFIGPKRVLTVEFFMQGFERRKIKLEDEYKGKNRRTEQKDKCRQVFEPLIEIIDSELRRIEEEKKSPPQSLF